MQQKIVGSPLALIGTSCYMLNTTRLKPGTWDRRTCQAMLQQAGINYSDMYTTYIVHFSDVDPNNESRQTQRELVRRLIVETWGPFMLRWNIVFFGKNMKSKRWVSRKNRKELKSRFLGDPKGCH